MLDHVDLLVPAGATLGLVGRTGSGKSTIGRLLARLWDTEEGTVLVGGVDVRALQLHSLRSRVGVVTQDVELFRASLRHNLTVFGAIAATDAELWAALEHIGLGRWASELPDQLDHHVDGPADLAGIGVPVTVAIGEGDEFIRQEHAAYLAATIPGADLVALPEVSHFAPLQRPDLFNRAVLRFLGRSG